jgi:hypothetical protein
MYGDGIWHMAFPMSAGSAALIMAGYLALMGNISNSHLMTE